MQAAQVLAGYSLGEADLLRRAMGKKIKAEMDAQRAALRRRLRRATRSRAAKANELFDLIDKFAGYGFNKSHAAAYALVAYQTAWLKAHYPVEFYAASMCFDMAQTDKLAIFVDDMRRLEVACLPPGINASEAEFAVEPIERRPRGALRAAARSRASARRRWSSWSPSATPTAPFDSLDDFAARVDPRLLNRRQIESLAGGGAFDAIEPNRAAVLAAAETILAVAVERRRARGSAGRAGCSARARPMSCRSACRAARPGRWPSGWRRRRRASASISRRTRSTATATSSMRQRRASYRRARARCRRPPTAAARAR